MENNQKEIDTILGEVSKETAQQIPKVGEFSVSELDLILGGIPREVGVDAALTNQEFYRTSQLENLTALENIATNNELSSRKK